MPVLFLNRHFFWLNRGSGDRQGALEMSSQAEIRVGGVPEHFNLPWQMAVTADAFARLPCGVQFIEFPGGTGAMTRALDLRQIDVALLLFEGAVTNILRGHPNRIVKVYVQSPLIWGIHVAANSSIEQIEDIRDRVYAISRAGSGSHLIAIVDAADRGWDTSAMKFSKVNDLAGAREKLRDGKVDVFFWERFSTQPLVDAGELRRIGERIVPWPAFVVSVREDALAQRRVEIQQTLEIVQLHCKRFLADPKATAIVTKKYGIQPADASLWFQTLRWNYGFERPDQTLISIIELLNDVGIVNRRNAGPDDIWFDLGATLQRNSR